MDCRFSLCLEITSRMYQNWNWRIRRHLYITWLPQEHVLLDGKQFKFTFIFIVLGRFLCKIAFACPVMCITTASYTLAMAAFERRNCIVDSLKCQVEIHHCKFIIPVIWVIAMIVATPTIIEFDVGEQVDNNGNITQLACNSNGMPYYYVVGNGIMLLFVTYVIPLSIISYNYLKIIQFVYHWKMFSNGQSSEVEVAKSIILQKKMRIIKMLIIVAMVFAVSWLPYFVTLIIGVRFHSISYSKTNRFYKYHQ